MGTVNEVDESELLARITQARDRQAFAELYDRLERKAFRLARTITGNSTLAEEAVQEAFCRIWIFTSSFTGGGNARAWALQIVVRESLKKVRSQRRGRRDLKEEGPRVAHRSVATGLAHSEQDEQVAALRGALASLPILHQRLIGLYFGAEMSQQQISEALRIPTRTVSDKLERSLAQLKEKLKYAGWSAWVPLSFQALVSEALFSGPVPVPGLRARVLAGLDARPSRSYFGWPSIAISALILGAACLAYTLAPELTGRPLAQAAKSGSDPAVPTAPLPVKPAFKELFWDFKAGPPSDLEVNGSSIRWIKDPALGAGAMEIRAASAGSGEKVPFFSPRTRLRSPCSVEFKVRCFPQANYLFGASFGPDNPWASEVQTESYQRASVKHENTRLRSNVDWYRLRFYVLDWGFLGYMDSDLCTLALHGRPKAPDWDRLFFYVAPYGGRTVIDDLRIRELPDSEIPMTLEQAQMELNPK